MTVRNWLLFKQPPHMFSHQVNGTGPLAGLYQLTNSEEPRCKYDSKYYFPVAFFLPGMVAHTSVPLEILTALRPLETMNMRQGGVFFYL